MASVTKTIDIDVSPRTAYNQWTQFEEFPEFMDGVKEVRQLDDTHLHWRAEVAGKDVEWNSEIIEQIPDQRICWASTSGPLNEGVVSFTSAGPGDSSCRVTLEMRYEPEGAIEKAGNAVGILGSKVEGDLKRFKKFLESRGGPTGAWRGEVNPDQQRPGL